MAQRPIWTLHIPSKAYGPYSLTTLYRDAGGRFISATVWEAAWLLVYGEVPDDGGEVAPLTAAEVAELAEEFGVPHEYSEEEEAILDDLRDFEGEWCEIGTEFELTATYSGGK